MSTRLPCAVFALALLALPSAQAEEIYKWVDANGVTNYSSAPPAHAGTASKLEIVPPRISSYPPDASLREAADAATTRELDRKIGSLERALDAERQARQNAAAAEARMSLAVYDQCVAERRVDCDGYGAYAPYAPVVIAARRPRLQPFAPIMPLGGVTAGSVVEAIRSGGGNVNQTPGAMGTRMSPAPGVPALRSRGRTDLR